jgi:rare lipoprotein A
MAGLPHTGAAFLPRSTCVMAAGDRGDRMGHQLAGADFFEVARAGALALACLALANCSGANKEYSPRVVEEGEPVPKGGGIYRVGKPYTINGRTYVPHENPSYHAEGVASWYGRDFHGRRTANGEVYDMHSISAAHPTMPLPSYARVTNLENGRSIIVRVNDRGPYTRDRLIDLSIGTAKALAFHSKGIARVRVEYVGRAPMTGSDDEMLMATLRERGPAPAPSKVMVAAAKPFLPAADEAKEETQEPKFALSSASSRPAPAPTAKTAAAAPRQLAKAGMRSASAADVRAEPPPETQPEAPAAPPFSFFPVRNDGGALGLMSGRGLY